MFQTGFLCNLSVDSSSSDKNADSKESFRTRLQGVYQQHYPVDGKGRQFSGRGRPYCGL